MHTGHTFSDCSFPFQLIRLLHSEHSNNYTNIRTYITQ